MIFHLISQMKGKAMKKNENVKSGVVSDEANTDNNRSDSEQIEYEGEVTSESSDEIKDPYDLHDLGEYETLNNYEVTPDSRMGAFIMDFETGTVSVLLTQELYEDDDALMEIFEEHPIAQNTMMLLCGLKAVLCDPIHEGDPMVKVALEKLMDIGFQFQMDDSADARMEIAEPRFKPTLH